MKAGLSIAAALVATMMATLAAWQERPVFRAEVNYVEVTARVVDKAGRFIDGLTAKDFSVAEDRRVEPVHQVIRVSLPTPWNSSASAPPVLYRPDLPREQRVAEGRIYLLYLNSIDVAHVPVTRQIAKDFVNRYVLIDDVVAVWSAFGAVTFTSDKLLLSRRIDEFLGSVETLRRAPAARCWSGRDAWGSDVGVAVVQQCPGTQEVRPALFRGLDRHRAGLLGPPDTSPLHEQPAGSGRHSDLCDRHAGPCRECVPFHRRSECRGRGSEHHYASRSGVHEPEQHEVARRGHRRLCHHQPQRLRRALPPNRGREQRYYVIGYSSSRKVGQAWDYREITLKLTNPAYKDARILARRGYIARR